MSEELQNLTQEDIDNLPIDNQTNEEESQEQAPKRQDTYGADLDFDTISDRELEEGQRYVDPLHETYIAPYTPKPAVQFLGNTGVFDKKEDSYAPLRMRDTFDMNEVRAQRQTKTDKWVHGLTKAVGKVGTNVIGGAIGTVYGAGSAIINGSVSKIWDNSIMHALDDANE